MNTNEIRGIIGKEYVHGTFAEEENDYIRDAYTEIARINRELFDRIPFEVIFTSEDHYTSASQMREAVQATGTLFIYDGWSGHPYLTQEENNIGRAVHDCWAHLVCGCPFTFEGEYNAYLEQRKHYPEWTWRVLFAEIPGQTSAYYFSKSFNYKQRAFEAPQAWLDLCQPLKRDYSKTRMSLPTA